MHLLAERFVFILFFFFFLKGDDLGHLKEKVNPHQMAPSMSPLNLPTVFLSLPLFIVHYNNTNIRSIN
jgi:hypothetical protein